MVMHVIRSFFIVFGAFEVLSNFFHLTRGSKKEIAQSASKQHRELPMGLSEGHLVAKAAIMLGFGLIFLIMGLLMTVMKGFLFVASTVALMVFGFYGIAQAFAYRGSINTILAALAYNIPMMLIIII